MRRREVMVIIGGAAASWVRLNEHMEHPQGAVVFQHIQSLREKSINVTGYKPDTNTRRSRVIAQGDLFEGATTRARPACRAFGAVPGGAQGIPWNPHTVRYRLLAARAAPKHGEVEQQRQGFGGFFEATPGVAS